MPDSAWATLDIRRIPSETGSTIISKLQKNFLFPDTSIETIEDEPPNITDRKHPLVIALAKSVTSVLGKKAQFLKEPGASDARFFSEVGVPAIVFGPAGHGLHSNDEWINISSLDKFYHILEHFLMSLN